MFNLKNEILGTFNKEDNGLNQLILINIIVFIVFLFFRTVLILSGNEVIYNRILHWFMIPAEFSQFSRRPWALFSYFFLHENLFHIFFNMLFLYWFGKIIKEMVGNNRLISLYILGGLAGAVLYLFCFNIIPYYKAVAVSSVMMGASASVMAIVVGAATLVPDYTFYLFFFGPVKIKYIALFYVIMAISGLTEWNAGGEIAHIGGSVMGVLFILQLKKGYDWGKPVMDIVNWIVTLVKPKAKMKVTYSNPSKTSKVKTSVSKKPDQETIDKILDKISRSGYESLTMEEKQLLFQASGEE